MTMLEYTPKSVVLEATLTIAVDGRVTTLNEVFTKVLETLPDIKIESVEYHLKTLVKKGVLKMATGSIGKLYYPSNKTLEDIH